ncbi:MAG TPA: helix-turn-helix transcriptional regulator [Solirubrobacterales bacterium]|nr:helix-turn-helix transcriptional regulator [Solirubrobacterales bacterium]
MSDGYAVSCSCGWVGGNHDEPSPAEQEAADHEANPDAIATQAHVLTVVEQFAWNLRRIRAKQNLSQTDLAVRADLHRTQVSMLERAKRVAAVQRADVPAKGHFLISPVSDEN